MGGIPCTVVQLKALGSQLIDIHGQHDGQQLLDEACHLQYLDNFGGLHAALTSYQEAYEKLDTLRREIASLQMDEAEKARRLDILQFQIEELERAELRPGEEEELEARKTILRSADQLVAAVEGAYGAIFGDEDRDGPVSWQKRRAVSHLSWTFPVNSRKYLESWRIFVIRRKTQRNAYGICAAASIFPPVNWTR